MRSNLIRALGFAAVLALAGCDCSKKPSSSCDAGFSLMNGKCEPTVMSSDTDAGTMGAQCVSEHRVCAESGGRGGGRVPGGAGGQGLGGGRRRAVPRRAERRGQVHLPDAARLLLGRGPIPGGETVRRRSRRLGAGKREAGAGVVERGGGG